MSDTRLHYRAEITATELNVLVEVQSRLVPPGTPGWFVRTDDAWTDAAARLTRMSAALYRKADELEGMVQRHRYG